MTILLIALRTLRAIAALYVVLSGSALAALMLEPGLGAPPFGLSFNEQAVVFGVSLAIVLVLRRLANELHNRVKPGEPILPSHWHI